MPYPLISQNFGRVDSLYGAIAKLVAANVNISPIVQVSMYPASARLMPGSPVSFYYFMAPDNDPDVAQCVNEGLRRNVAHYCPDTGAVVIETGMQGLGRDCGVMHDSHEDIGKMLLPLLAGREYGANLIKAGEQHAIARSLLDQGSVFDLWLGYRRGRLHVYVTKDDERPGPSDCRHLLWGGYARGNRLD